MTAHFRDAVSLIEACVAEIERQEAMFYAPFKPGDCIDIERTICGERTTIGPYLVVDVLPDKGLGTPTTVSRSQRPERCTSGEAVLGSRLALQRSSALRPRI
jgi:hypothetical protein